MMKHNRKMICAYLSDWGWRGLSKASAACLTHVNYSFALVRDGVVTDAHWTHAEELDDAIRMYPELTFVVSVGGWGAGGFSEAASTAEGRERFAETAVALMRRHGFRGIDVDWEYPCRSDADIASSPDDKRNFTLLMQALRTHLNEETARTGKDYLLSIAVGAGAGFTKDMELEQLNPILDYVNLMTYDMKEWNRVTHHSNLYPSGEYEGGWSAVQSARVYGAAGIDRNKLVLGGAFYGHSYDVTGDHPLGQTENFRRAKTMSYSRIRRECTAENGWIKYRDEAACAPYLYNGKTLIIYDDEQALADKVDYVCDAGLGGIMFWEFNEDDSETLVRAIADAMQKHETT